MITHCFQMEVMAPNIHHNDQASNPPSCWTLSRKKTIIISSVGATLLVLAVGATVWVSIGSGISFGS